MVIVKIEFDSEAYFNRFRNFMDKNFTYTTVTTWDLCSNQRIRLVEILDMRQEGIQEEREREAAVKSLIKVAKEHWLATDETQNIDRSKPEQQVSPG